MDELKPRSEGGSGRRWSAPRMVRVGSLVACVVFLGLWVSGFFVSLIAGCGVGSRGVGVWFAGGRAMIWTGTDESMTGWRGGARAYHAVPGSRPLAKVVEPTMSECWEAGRFGVGTRYPRAPVVVFVSVPLWFLVGVTAVAPVRSIFRKRRGSLGQGFPMAETAAADAVEGSQATTPR